MKKSLLLLLVPFLFLYGCGGGPGDMVTGDLGATGDLGGTAGSGSGTVVDAGNLTITLPTVQAVQPMALVPTDGLQRTDARFVVRKTEPVITETPVTENVCTWELDPADPDYLPIDDPEAECFDRVVPGEFITTTVDTETYKQIVDLELTDGGGTVSIFVPPGSGYTLEILTSVWLDSETLNLMWEYDQSAPFDIASGVTTTVPMTLSQNLATLALPVDPVVSGDFYVVACTKTEALRDQWYIRQTVDPSDLSASWFLHDNFDFGVGGTGDIPLQAPIETGSAAAGQFVPDWTVWHHGQFYINSNLLKSGEGYLDWTFGTSAAGPLNPMGSVEIVLQ